MQAMMMRALFTMLVCSGFISAVMADPVSSPLMPKPEDYTQMWWAEGFPTRVPNAPWRRCIQTGNYAFVLDTETLRVPHFGSVPPGTDYADSTRSEAWRALPAAELGLHITVDGKSYRATAGGKWTQRTGPRLIESGRFLQRADVTNLEFKADDGSILAADARFETVAWPDRLGLILAARPGLQSIPKGEDSFGRVGGGFGFDGTNHFEIPPRPEFDAAQFTLELWAFVPTDYVASPRTFPWLVCYKAHEQAEGNFGIILQNGKAQARLNIGGGRENGFTASSGRHALKLDAWNHLAISYDGSTLRLFVNGEAAGEQKIDRPRVAGKGALAVGRRQDNSGDGYHFRGVVDEIRWYDHALQPSEIQLRYRKPELDLPDSKATAVWGFRADGTALNSQPRMQWRNASMQISLTSKQHVLQQQRALPNNATDWQEVAVKCDPAHFQTPIVESPIQVSATEISKSKPLPVSHDAARSWHEVNLDGIEPIVPHGPPEKQNDAVERIKLVLSNPTEREEIARLLFSKSRSGIRQRIGTAITGITAVLRDAEGNPTGIPVQLSKNWHNHEDVNGYADQWFHGFSQIRLPAKAQQTLELTLAYGHWGGIPAASHAQLCLIGWGSNQLWDQSALGSWGETICYEPDQAQAQCMVTDVRPLMVRGMRSGDTWGWTHNVGGADFFRLFDASGNRKPPLGMRTYYQSQGPCLTQVTYAGQLAPGLEHAVTTSLGRTDDLVRATYQLRLQVKAATAFSRFVFFQIGADTYSYTGERKMAWGNAAGLQREWSTKWGGNTNRSQPVECQGSMPWVSLHEAVARREPEDKGAWANRGFIIRAWKAKLGGQPAAPWIVEHGVDARGNESSTMDLVPPPNVEKLLPGDFVDATIEFLILPQFSKDYYGPNEALRSALEKDGNTWRMMLREAVQNDRQVEMKQGTNLQRHPAVIIRTEQGAADFSLRGGLGYVPLTFTQMPSSLPPKLLIDGTPLNQSVHGNDFWQTDYDAKSLTWSHTFNVPLAGPDQHRIQLVPSHTP